MVIRNILLSAIFLLIVGSAKAQNPHLDFKRAVILYNLSTFEQELSSSQQSQFYSNFTTTNYVELFHPTITLRWRTRKGNFKEVELTRLSFGGVGVHTDFVEDSTFNILMSGGSSVYQTLLECRYEYLLTFRKGKDKKLVPCLGFGVKPKFMRQDYKFDSPALSPKVSHLLAAEVQVVPRLTYFPNDRVFMDINVPLNLFYMNYEINKTDDPNGPGQEQINSTFNLESLPMRFSLRFGVGLKF